MATRTGQDTLGCRKVLAVGSQQFDYFSLEAASRSIGDLSRLPFSMRVLLENLLRFEDGRSVRVEDIEAVFEWQREQRSEREIAFRPARVLMQDFTGVPAVVDLAAMRDAVSALGGDPELVNPLAPVDLVVDHSVTVDHFAQPQALARNVAIEYERNRERYEFLRWGREAFDNFRVVPPGTGICHQVNLEYLARTVWSDEDQDARVIAYPDTLVGTDSHTTMINGLGVLGWGVGGIEAEAAMLGQPVSMLIPQVVGCRLSGDLKEGVTATDLVLTVTELLRNHGVVGKFVEFFGDGLDHLSLADRATIANMAPEYGATCGIFPVDGETLRYLALTGRSSETLALVEAYAKTQGLWRDSGTELLYSERVELDLGQVEPCLAGPKRPQDRVTLSGVQASARQALVEVGAGQSTAVAGEDFRIEPGAVVIAAITSCTNTSNPDVLVAAGLVARKARELGLTTKPWVKTSFAPGSQVVTDYLSVSGLQADLDALGFGLVGYGCTTCIGNSGPLAAPIDEAIAKGKLAVGAVLSGNRNFEGRVHPATTLNYLASPPLVVAYALVGNLTVDLATDPVGVGADGNAVYLRDLWPSNEQVKEVVEQSLSPDLFRQRYAQVFDGDERWQAMEVAGSLTYPWSGNSTYVRFPAFLKDVPARPEAVVDIEDARVLLKLGDSVTTDHISPAGNIPQDGPAGTYLAEHQVRVAEFNSYGARRGNHEVMVRGTFGNIRLRNEMAPGTQGGFTVHQPSGEEMSVFDAAARYARDQVPLVVVGGKEYGTGSSRDWAAKGTRLLGVRAVIVESFERIHRSNLIGMGVLPLQFAPGVSRESLELTGTETFSLRHLGERLAPGCDLTCSIVYPDGRCEDVSLRCRIDTQDEMDYYRHGGILPYVLRNLIEDSKAR